MKSAFLLIILLGSAISAQESGAGTTLFQFLKLEYDGRSSAMSGATAGMPSGAYGLLSNPAATGFVDTMQSFLGARSLILDLWGISVGSARPVSGVGVIGIFLVGFSEGVVDEINENKESTGRIFGSNYLGAGISWATRITPDLSAGLVFKGLYHRLGTTGELTSAKALALDLGMQYRIMGNKLLCGLMLRNAGIIVSSYGITDAAWSLPLSIQAGVSFVPENVSSLRLALDLEKPVDDFLTYRPALEWAIYKRYLFVRAGLRFSQLDLETAFSTFSGSDITLYQKSNWNFFTLGVGIAAPVGIYPITIDIAYITRTENTPASYTISGTVQF